MKQYQWTPPSGPGDYTEIARALGWEPQEEQAKMSEQVDWQETARELYNKAMALTAQLAQAREDLEAWPVKWAHTIDNYSQLLGETRAELAQARALLLRSNDVLQVGFGASDEEREQHAKEIRTFLAEEEHEPTEP